jgi:hypothetical protein
MTKKRDQNGSSERSATSKEELSPRQLKAIDLLVAGVPKNVIEKRVKVRRETLWRWETENALFQREKQLRSTAVRQRQADRLIALLGESIEVLRENVSEGDPEISLDIVRAFGPLLPLEQPTEVFERHEVLEVEVDQEDQSRNHGKLSYEQ